MYENKIKGWLKHGDFMVIDILCLQLSFTIAYIFRMGIPYDGLPELYRDLMLVITFVDICVAFLANSYKNIVKRGYLLEFKQVLCHNALVECGVIIWLFITKHSSDYSRVVIISMYPVCVCLMTCMRLAWKRLVRNRIRNKQELKRLLVITTKQRAAGIIDGLQQPYRDYTVIGVSLYDAPETVGGACAGNPGGGGSRRNC